MRPRTQHGQNFLIDLNLLELLVAAARLSPHDVVLEVGTGTGSLTTRVAPLAAHVVTVEIDPHMAELARSELAACPNVTLLVQDALRNKNQLHPAVLAAVREQLAAAPGRCFKLVANLPYHVATPVISNLLDLEDAPQSMTITIQKELAERIMAHPSTKDYGALSIWVQSQCRAEIVRLVPPEAFWPRPKVASAILRLELDPPRRGQIQDRQAFHELVRGLFLHRRKLLRGVLASLYRSRLDKPKIDALLSSLGLADSARAEELDVPGMIRLCDALRQATAEH
ncbi:MAG: 16S rRNA (adenine(1518)-N(6)/adenine(1519)-N(6))-dimethyltransferase RsmA [Pirellulales bacterium]|nr:16S rRNA (adenine(1518)-N(6)/adenine(1519)-N(6))-dimethyltransferase RsmA [Pirellulales bacterium]